MHVIGRREIQGLARNQDTGAVDDDLGLGGKRPLQCEPKREVTSRANLSRGPASMGFCFIHA